MTSSLAGWIRKEEDSDLRHGLSETYVEQWMIKQVILIVFIAENYSYHN